MSEILLNAGEIFDSTAKKYGLEKYIDAGMRRRFTQLIESFNAQGGVPDWTYPAAHEQLVAIVKRRLELARDWATHPEILNERIEQPLFAVGSARTGTTLVQNLLALGDGCRTTLSWECRSPSPPPGFDPKSEPGRIAAEHQYILEMINLFPGLLLSHPYVDQKAFMEVEDEDIFANDFHTAFPWHFTRVRNLPIVHHKRETGLVEALQFHKKFLQQLQWKKPTKHWVCKTPQHFFGLPATWEVYPDALCVFTHRDPAVFVSSVLGIIEHVYTPLLGTKIHGEFAHELANNLAAGYEAILNGGWVDDKRLVHVRFDDLVRDPVGTMRSVYKRGGLEFSKGYEERINRWLTDPANKGDRHGKYLYSLEQFGLDAASIKKKFAGYYARFVN